MFSKKATKIDEMFIIDLTLCSKRQIDGEDFVNFCCLPKKHKLYTQIHSLPSKFSLISSQDKNKKWETE